MTLAIVKPESRKEPETSIHFSYSQLNTYLICSMKYKFQYVQGVPWETRPAAMAFGKAIHKAAETYYVNLKETGEIIPLDDLTGTFEIEFGRDIKKTELELTYKSGETSESLRNQGVELLKLFHAEVSPQKIVAVEHRFSVGIPDILNGQENLPIRLVGYFDLVESDSQNTYLIVELKTSSQRFSSLKLEYDLQATVYSYAMSRMKLAISDNSTLVRYDVLLKTKKPAFERYFVSRTPADHRRLIHLINYVLKAIENRIFYRNTGWQCGDCQFKKTCFA